MTWELSILCRLRSYDRFRLLRRFGHDLISLRNAHNFFDSRFALGNTSPAILPQSFHTFSNGALLELAAVAFLHDQFSQRLRHQANLVNGRAALIAGLPALIAAAAATKTGAELFHR